MPDLRSIAFFAFLHLHFGFFAFGAKEILLYISIIYNVRVLPLKPNAINAINAITVKQRRLHREVVGKGTGKKTPGEEKPHRVEEMGRNCVRNGAACKILSSPPCSSVSNTRVLNLLTFRVKSLKTPLFIPDEQNEQMNICFFRIFLACRKFILACRKFILVCRKFFLACRNHFSAKIFADIQKTPYLCTVVC